MGTRLTREQRLAIQAEKNLRAERPAMREYKQRQAERIETMHRLREDRLQREAAERESK
jgi:hypothetical protein